jgi:protein-tyrosine-phosphatase
MAEAFFTRISKGWSAASAGTRPDIDIHPWTVELMKETGIDASQQKPKLLTDEMLKGASCIVAMDFTVLIRIPLGYQSKVKNWDVDTLLGKRKAEVRRIRDEIDDKTRQLYRSLLKLE